jgi:hypothetical protein
LCSSRIRNNKTIAHRVFKLQAEEREWEPTKRTVPDFSSCSSMLEEPETNHYKVKHTNEKNDNNNVRYAI